MARTVPDWVRRAQAKWQYRGEVRPPFAQVASAGQESVWDYPRPPAIVPDARRVVVCDGGKVIADSVSAMRVLETASPPTFYLPPADVDVSQLEIVDGSSFCEWKGLAQYWMLRNAKKDRHMEPVAWGYTDPFPGFEAIAGYFAFYPGRIECYVNEERVVPQPGGLYGGWVTSEIVGPFKGEPGTEHW